MITETVAAMNGYSGADEVCSSDICFNEYREDRISLYDGIKPVGKGKFATVYRANRIADNETVALKRISIHAMSNVKRNKVLQEVRLLQSLDHPNIIRYLDSFLTGNDLIIVFQWAAAGDLKKQIRKAQEKELYFEERVIWNLFWQICCAIEHMHSRRILHRDLKPANIFLTKRGQVKVGDLGLGRELSKDTLEVHSKVGTPLYMSPEVLRGQGYDWKSDIWSLGCVIYELCMLRSPFKTEGINLYSLFQKINEGEYELLPENYSVSLREVIYALINTDPMKRPCISDLCVFTENMHLTFERNDEVSRESVQQNSSNQSELLVESATKHASRDLGKNDRAPTYENVSNAKQLAPYAGGHSVSEKSIAKKISMDGRNPPIFEDETVNMKQNCMNKTSLYNGKYPNSTGETVIADPHRLNRSFSANEKHQFFKNATEMTDINHLNLQGSEGKKLRFLEDRTDLLEPQVSSQPFLANQNRQNFTHETAIDTKNKMNQQHSANENHQIVKNETAISQRNENPKIRKVLANEESLNFKYETDSTHRILNKVENQTSPVLRKETASTEIYSTSTNRNSSFAKDETVLKLTNLTNGNVPKSHRSTNNILPLSTQATDKIDGCTIASMEKLYDLLTLIGYFDFLSTNKKYPLSKLHFVLERKDYSLFDDFSLAFRWLVRTYTDTECISDFQRSPYERSVEFLSILDRIDFPKELISLISPHSISQGYGSDVITILHWISEKIYIKHSTSLRKELEYEADLDQMNLDSESHSSQVFIASLDHSSHSFTDKVQDIRFKELDIDHHQYEKMTHTDKKNNIDPSEWEKEVMLVTPRLNSHAKKVFTSSSSEGWRSRKYLLNETISNLKFESSDLCCLNEAIGDELMSLRKSETELTARTDTQQLKALRIESEALCRRISKYKSNISEKIQQLNDIEILASERASEVGKESEKITSAKIIPQRKVEMARLGEEIRCMDLQISVNSEKLLKFQRMDRSSSYYNKSLKF